LAGLRHLADQGGGGPVLLITGALILLGSGAAAAVATSVVVALIAAAAVIVLSVAGLVAYLIYRARHSPAAAPWGHDIIPAPVLRLLDAPERPALEQPRELHLHFHGTGPEQVAEILRRHERPEP
jgi:hypothetical protein